MSKLIKICSFNLGIKEIKNLITSRFFDDIFKTFDHRAIPDLDKISCAVTTLKLILFLAHG